MNTNNLNIKPSKIQQEHTTTLVPKKNLYVNHDNLKPVFHQIIKNFNSHLFKKSITHDKKESIENVVDTSNKIINSNINLSQALYDNNVLSTINEKNKNNDKVDLIFENFKNYSLSDFQILLPNYKNFIENNDISSLEKKWQYIPEIQSVSTLCDAVYEIYSSSVTETDENA